MERKSVTAIVFGLFVAAGVVYAMIRLAGLVQAAQQIPHH